MNWSFVPWNDWAALLVSFAAPVPTLLVMRMAAKRRRALNRSGINGEYGVYAFNRVETECYRLVKHGIVVACIVVGIHGYAAGVIAPAGVDVLHARTWGFALIGLLMGWTSYRNNRADERGRELRRAKRDAPPDGVPPPPVVLDE